MLLSDNFGLFNYYLLIAVNQSINQSLVLILVFQKCVPPILLFEGDGPKKNSGAHAPTGPPTLQPSFRPWFSQIVLTVPIASASAGRSFSTMKRVKTYLRSTMADQRLNDLCLLAIEREMSRDLLNDPSSVITKFAMLAERKLPLIK